MESFRVSLAVIVLANSHAEATQKVQNAIESDKRITLEVIDKVGLVKR
jgi:hypothetical protein